MLVRRRISSVVAVMVAGLLQDLRNHFVQYSLGQGTWRTLGSVDGGHGVEITAHIFVGSKAL